MAATTHISATEMKAVFEEILLAHGFTPERAEACAQIFTNNSVDGVFTHGVNRFPRFVSYIKKGLVKPGASPSLQQAIGGLEQWHGNYGPGPLNAVAATERAIQLSRANGIGCVALSHTNHWMRGGYYAWQAAASNCVFIGWTNTIANMPAWNAKDSKLGNNPLVIGIPYGDGAIVMDMATSQFSFGTMEGAAIKGETLPVDGGFDTNGAFTKDPKAILESMRPLPIGYWKGAGLTLLLDLLAAILSGGLATHEISKQKNESGLSQVFIAIDLSRLGNHSFIRQTVENILQDYLASQPSEQGKTVRYPGQRVLDDRKRHLEKGIPVLQEIWNDILHLKNSLDVAE